MFSLPLFRRQMLAGISGVFALALVAGALNPASAACKNRGDLDQRFCDDNGDLVADTPTDKSKLLDPDTLVFSYTPVEDPSVYENVFTEFMTYLSKKTGKKVKWYGADSYAAQVEALRSGRLHVAGISTGPTVFGVNLAGYVPISIMGKADGRFGYKLQLITHKSSNIKKVSDLKDRKVAHVTPSSNSGNQAPRALFKSMGIVPDKDYKVTYSGKHDNSIMGVANKDYDAAPVASSVLDRMHDKGVVNKKDLNIIWESKFFPTTSYGYAHNLTPDLQAKIKDAFLSFNWKGTMLAKEFGKQADMFIPITYKEHWSDIRTIQKTNGVVYSQDALMAEDKKAAEKAAKKRMKIKKK
ncbi:MAG: phosphate/phosphite/phosphonate ABC transporter substrate-binding protein [Proteobacteria bacterium]|nr:phosphate/phosphite/phosphonate ABC transporter substrate-binding protein [Pseudomonadota bacterium]